MVILIQKEREPSLKAVHFRKRVSAPLRFKWNVSCIIDAFPYSHWDSIHRARFLQAEIVPRREQTCLISTWTQPLFVHEMPATLGDLNLDILIYLAGFLDLHALWHFSQVLLQRPQTL